VKVLLCFFGRHSAGRLAMPSDFVLHGYQRFEGMADKVGDSLTHGRPSAGLDLADKILYTQDVVHGRILLSLTLVCLSGEYALLFSPFPFYTMSLMQPDCPIFDFLEKKW
jgi:hypothetical protein